jgi:hypothetical protein
MYVWSLAGLLTWSGTFREFAALHGLSPRSLFVRLLVLQGAADRDPEPLRLTLPSGDVLVTLIPRLGTVPSLH